MPTDPADTAADGTPRPPAGRNDVTLAHAAVADTAADLPLPLIPGYELRRELGRGGMGIVYLAHQTSLRRDVALKVLLSGTLAGGLERERFRAEAESAGALAHPHIVGVFETGEVEGRPFFSMQYVPGSSLAERLRFGPLEPRSAAELLATVADALHFAHERGVLHRDIKPHNVMLDAETGRPVVTDFGLARRVGEPGQTATGAILGTPAYMAPEQAGGHGELSAATDVYALGAVLYECLTGRVPFQAANPIETIAQLLENPPAPPRLLNPGVPRDLETICLKCLEKDPARRYASAAELADDLRRYARGEPIAARSLNLVERLVRAVEHDRLDEEFARYGSMLCWFALVMSVPEMIITVIVLNDWHAPLLALVQFARAGLFLLLLAWWRGWRLVPETATERHLWATWAGYLVCCFVLGLSNRMLYGWTTGIEPKLYLSLAPLTALAFVSIAPRYWGGFYVCGGVFLGLPLLMVQDIRWAALEFGLTWAAVLFLIGVRLRTLARAR